MDAGLKAGDAIMSVNAQPLTAFRELQDLTKASNGAEMALKVWRDGEVLDVTLTPRMTDLPTDEGFETRWLIGLNGGLMFEPAVIPMGIGAALKNSVLDVAGIMKQSLSALYHVASGAISQCNLRGAIGIAETAGEMASQGIGPFIRFIALLSVAVGLINLFPIPILDGGHLVFHAYELVFRRPPSARALGVLMTFGLVIVVAFMSFALINDFRCP
jgi:regulator of sigma E protease